MVDCVPFRCARSIAMSGRGPGTVPRTRSDSPIVRSYGRREYTMRMSALNLRWRYLAGPGLLAAAAATMAWSAPADKPTPDQQPTTKVAKAADLPVEAVDVSDKVEVTVQGALKSTSRTAHSTSIRVKNTSKED